MQQNNINVYKVLITSLTYLVFKYKISVIQIIILK